MCLCLAARLQLTLFCLSCFFFPKQMQIEFWWTAHSSRIGNSNSEIVMNCNQNVQQWNKDWDANKCSQCCSFLHLTWPKSGNLARTKNNQSLNVASHWMTFRYIPLPYPTPIQNSWVALVFTCLGLVVITLRSLKNLSHTFCGTVVIFTGDNLQACLSGRSWEHVWSLLSNAPKLCCFKSRLYRA